MSGFLKWRMCLTKRDISLILPLQEKIEALEKAQEEDTTLF
jgi:hypothetical protein